jgi:diacylglycerol kinase family enzyme
MAESTFVVVNPRAQEGRLGDRWPELERELAGALGDGAVRTQFTTASDFGSGMVRAALREGASRVVAIGGDGTASEVLQGFFADGKAVRPDASLVILPYGRGNDFFKSLAGRGPSSTAWERGLKLLRDGKPTSTDVCRVRFRSASGKSLERYLINSASFGITGDVVKRVRTRAGFWGRSSLGKTSWAYLLQFGASITEYRNLDYGVRVDGRTAYEGPLLVGFILNGAFSGGGIHWSPEVRIDDGLLHALLFEPRTVASTLTAMPRMINGDWSGIPGVRLVSGRSIQVDLKDGEAPPYPLFETDGDQPEPAGTFGADFEVAPGAVRIWR